MRLKLVLWFGAIAAGFAAGSAYLPPAKRWILYAGLSVVALLKVAKIVLKRHLETKPRVAINAVYAVSSAENSPDAVLSVLDRAVGLNMAVGAEKGALLDSVVTERAPSVVVEFGAYFGYSAIRIARLLREGSMLYTIEKDPVCAAISARIVEYAGLSRRVQVIVGTAGSVLPRLRDTYGVQHIDVLFIDHAKKAYLPDLRTAEQLGFIKEGSVVIADNMSMAKEYFAAVQADKAYESRHYSFHIRLFLGIKFKDSVLVSKRIKAV